MKKKLTIVLTLLFVLLLPLTCSANERYQRIGSNDKTGFFFDTHTIKYELNDYQKTVDKTTINFWLKTVYTKAGVQDLIARLKKSNVSIEGWETLDYCLENEIISKDKNFCIIFGIYYAKDGTILAHNTYSSYSWKKVIPGTFSESIYQAVWDYASNEANSRAMEIEARQ